MTVSETQVDPRLNFQFQLGLDPDLPPTEELPLAVAYGAGVDSTAMLIGLKNRGIKVDLIMFADTGSEKKKTYDYLPVMQAWLAKHSMPPITIVRNASPIAGDKSLHGECLRKSVLPSLAYNFRLHSCSIKWKVEPQNRYCRKFFGWNGRTKTFRHGPYIYKAVGYDAGDADNKRIIKSKDVWPEGHINRYFLKEWGWDRERCRQEIVNEGLPVPVKSACFFCPASKEDEIHQLQEDEPESIEVALEIERKAKERGLTSCKGLGCSFSWTELLGRA